jgi:DNA ligase-1
MKQFAALIESLSVGSKTNAKLQALQHYFETASNEDKVWVIAIFSGRRPKRAVSTALLRQWCKEQANITDWLFEECYHTVGDLAETIALLVPKNEDSHGGEQTLTWYLHQLSELIKAG